MFKIINSQYKKPFNILTGYEEIFIGSDGFGYKVTKAGMQKIPHTGVVTVGRGVEIGANCSIDRALFDATVIGDGVKIDNNVHVAHNVIIGSGSAILAQTGIAGSAVIGMGCQIGGQVAIKNNVRIGNFAKVVSKSGVLNDIKDGETVAGIPAIPFGQWKRFVVASQKLPEMIKLGKELTSLVTLKRAGLFAKIKFFFFGASDKGTQ